MKHTHGSAQRLARWGDNPLLKMFVILSILGLLGLAYAPPSQAQDTTTTAANQAGSSQTNNVTPTKKTETSHDDYTVNKDGMSFEVNTTTTTQTSTTAPRLLEDDSMPSATANKSENSRAPPAGSDDECVNQGEMSPTHVELVACSYSETALETAVSGITRMLIDGFAQLTWWFPDHNVSVTNEAIKNAPWIDVKYTEDCSKQSKSIAKQANGASLVIAKVGSKICNTGKEGNIIGGFPWDVTVGPAILKWNKKLKLYEHIYNLVKPQNVLPGDQVVRHLTVKGQRYALVKMCKNRMGGHVDKMFDYVVQVRYSGDVMEESEVSGESSGAVSVSGVLYCPAGTLSGTATVRTETAVTITVQAKASLMAKAIEMAEGIVKAQASSKAKGDASAQSKALAAIELECNSAPTTSDSLTISGWSSWHLIKDSDGGWNEVTATSNGKEVGFSAPSVKSGPCAIVESSVVVYSTTKKTQRIRVRPLTGQTGTCVIQTRATAGTASEPWEGIIEIAPPPPGGWGRSQQ